MKYILLIYGNESASLAMSEEDQQAEWGAHMTYAQAAAEAGVAAGGYPLMPVTTATSVRVRDGKTLTTHGPFAETTEQLGGYYVLDCNNLDEALEWAAKNPSAHTGTVEVRPLVEV